MSNHDAPGQMSGYLFQVLSALILLLDNKNDSIKICIEKFDDVAFIEDDKPKTLIQVKHQLNKRGKLTNTSIDLWRSINSWCDSINDGSVSTLDTNFLILTTAFSPLNSAAFFLAENSRKRDTDKALKILIKAANGKQKSTQKFRNNFLKLSDDVRNQLVSQIYIYDNSPQIQDHRAELKRRIRYGTLDRFEEVICEQIEGWWLGKAIQFLTLNHPTYIDQKQVQTKIYEISSAYREDSLPITENFIIAPSQSDIDELGIDIRIFYEQLKLVNLSNQRINRAFREFYHAFHQRSKWVRNDLLYIDELEEYEKKLIDEWDRLFEISKEKIIDENITDEIELQQIGKELFTKIENLDIYIRERVTQPFIMRGSYHSLANKLKVGWHADFYERLYNILQGGAI